MTEIKANEMTYQQLNARVRETDGDMTIRECYGERFIAAGAAGKTITIIGTPGNALGAYLDGATVVVNGNAQDAVGDTMNEGRVVIHGGAGDALGYAMRGGEIYVRDSAGYRTGIHMKQYEEKRPVIVVGGRVGSFLGEYMAGGLLIVLGVGAGGAWPVGNFAGTGMHGGAMLIRCDAEPDNLPPQVVVSKAGESEMAAMNGYIGTYAELFGADAAELRKGPYWLLAPNAKNPYKQLYTAN